MPSQLARPVDRDAYLMLGGEGWVRSIGSVPVQTLSQQLERLLPIAEMDAAFELGVSWRQVRGASFKLVRNGVALWKRDRLLPVNREPGCVFMT